MRSSSDLTAPGKLEGAQHYRKVSYAMIPLENFAERLGKGLIYSQSTPVYLNDG